MLGKRKRDTQRERETRERVAGWKRKKKVLHVRETKKMRVENCFGGKNESGHGTERQESCSEEEGQSDAVRKRERERERESDVQMQRG